MIIFLVCENTNLDSEKFFYLLSWSVYDLLQDAKHIPKGCLKLLKSCANETQFIHKDYSNTRNLFEKIMQREKPKLLNNKKSVILNRIGMYWRTFYYDEQKRNFK